MSTVTPNFNWPVPTSTDLVKDGATAIEALGDSIDASLVDLKGGTTGQVLSKTSATDMDFTWVAQDDSNAIQNSIVNAKGDLIAASANDTPAILSVGTNGQTLVADSTASTGLKWATPGGGWNPDFQIINSGGTSLSGSATVTINVSGKNALYLYYINASSGSASAEIALRLNTDTGSNYFLAYVGQAGTAATSAAIDNADKFYLATMGNSATNAVDGHIYINGSNATGLKPISAVSKANGSTTNTSISSLGYYRGTSVITSVSLNCGTGNFDGGTVYVYGA